MSWHVAALNLDNLDDLPKRCRNCVYWELSTHLAGQADGYGTTDLEKEAWLSEVLLEWGSCGRVVYMGGAPAGYVIYAPPSAVPRASEMPTGPVSADAVLLTTMQIMPDFSGEGLGRMLAQAVVKDLTRRGVKAVEVFGDARPGTEADCVVPAEFLRAVGFKTVRPHHRWPRLRMELRSGLEWKEGVEAALEQLFNTVTIPLQAPAPVERRSPVRVGARAVRTVQDSAGQGRTGQFGQDSAQRRSEGALCRPLIHSGDRRRTEGRDGSNGPRWP